MEQIKQLHTFIHNIQLCAMELDELDIELKRKRYFWKSKTKHKEHKEDIIKTIQNIKEEISELAKEITYICKNE